jgi:glycosyltransferase involved in cell wall biosynthesis
MLKNNPFNDRIALIEPSGSYSGMQYYNFGMADGLILNGIQPFLFTTSSENIHVRKGMSVYNFFDKVWNSRFNISKFYFYYLGLIKSIVLSKKNQCHIVHLHQFHLNINLLITVTICKLFFNKLILTVHDVESFGGKKNRSNSLFASVLNLLVDKFIVHNKFSCSELSKEIKSNPVIIRHGNYIPFFKAMPYVSKNKKFNLLFFGLIKESKGLDILLDSLVILKDLGFDFQLTIAGRPWRNDFKKYQNIIETNNLENNISTSLYFISEIDLIKYFSTCDLVILPYRKIFQSGVVLKAMSLKRAVLCSNLPAFEELVIDGVNGYIFESENPNSLANKLKKIILQRNKLGNIVEHAYKTLENDFNWNSIGFELKNVYKNIYEKY